MMTSLSAIMVVMSESVVRRRKTQRERVDESAHRLMDAAIELIAARGYERTTVAEIGQRAGYSRTMVRERYGSKEALLEALIKSEYEEKLFAPASSGISGLDQILDRIDRLEAMRLRDARLLRALYVLQFEAVGPVLPLRPQVMEWFSRVRAGTIDALRAGQVDGSVRAAIDIEDEAEQFVLTGIGIAYRWALEGDTFDHAAALQRWKFRIGRQVGATGEPDAPARSIRRKSTRPAR